MAEEKSESRKIEMEKTKGENDVHWFFAPVLILGWLVLFFAIVYPIFIHLPEGVRIEQETIDSCRFVAERSMKILYEYEAIGEKVVGSFANENLTVQLIAREIEKVRSSMNDELYDLELDVQAASGSYMHWRMVNMYRGVQNVVVKLSPKNSMSQSYLLMNSHFDSKPGSPGSGDDGAMVVIMLEILRVLSSSKCASLSHPIVFLFNGAEEAPLEASHGFITQHKWAKNCKAFINLDCAGSGNREFLFQGGPNHPWLMKYYGKYVDRPFATTVAEEMFQSGLIPSDTDFRIFKNFGNIPGLDLAHTYNGYVYHTKFDKLDVIPLGTLQITGDHILSLAHGLANAPELENPKRHKREATIFYDFLGLFFIHYTENIGKILNTLVSSAAIVLSAISIWMFSKHNDEGDNFKRILQSFGLIFGLHFLGFILAFAFPISIAVLYDLDGRTMTWFTHKWLVIGQYICSSLFGLSAPTLVFISMRKAKPEVPKSFTVQMALHSQAIILALMCIGISFLGIRTSYLLMISIFFYSCAMIVNLITMLQNQAYWWMIPLLVSQVLPFLYFSYLLYTLLTSFMPMMGRNGSTINPDLYVAGVCALGTVLAMGFIVPTLSIFRRPKSILLSLVVVIITFGIISITSIGFPYRPKTNVHRVNVLHVNRTFYNYNGSIEKSDSGHFFDFQDRRKQHPSEETVDFTNLRSVAEDCDKEMMCGLPLFNHRWTKARYQGTWLPTTYPIEIPGTSTITLLRKTINVTSLTARFEFKLEGPNHLSIFMEPIEGNRLADWSFHQDVIEDPDKWTPPYHVFISCGIDTSPLEFYFDVKKNDNNFDAPSMKLGISAHYLSLTHPRGAAVDGFLKTFPDFVHVMEWPSSYKRYIF